MTDTYPFNITRSVASQDAVRRSDVGIASLFVVRAS